MKNLDNINGMLISIKKRCEDNMLNIIENNFGKDTKIIMGDWCIKNK